MSKYVHHTCSCGGKWDSGDFMNECPFCGSTNIEYTESNERQYEDFYYAEDEDDEGTL